MKSVRLSLFVFVAATALFGASACLSESSDDGLNPQPLPPATGEPPPETPGGGAFGSDDGKNSATGASSGGSSNPPPSPAADAGTGDAGKLRYEIRVH